MLFAVGVAMMLMGLAALFSGLVAIFPPGMPRTFMPALMVAVGSTLTICAVHLRLSQSPETRVGQAPADGRVWLEVGALLIGMLTVSLFFDRLSTRRSSAAAMRGWTRGKGTRTPRSW